jgi:hypothetical protein
LACLMGGCAPPSHVPDQGLPVGPRFSVEQLLQCAATFSMSTSAADGFFARSLPSCSDVLLLGLSGFLWATQLVGVYP